LPRRRSSGASCPSSTLPGWSRCTAGYRRGYGQRHFTERAKAKGVDVSELVNDLLKRDIELIEAAK
jgi:hypothetical protein